MVSCQYSFSEKLQAVAVFSISITKQPVLLQVESFHLQMIVIMKSKDLFHCILF